MTIPELQHAVDRHSHWGALNTFDEARGADLFAPDGSKVVAQLDAIGGWFVAHGTPPHVTVTGGVIETASMLNHLGVLPRAMHEQWLRSRTDATEFCPSCGAHVEEGVLHSDSNPA